MKKISTTLTTANVELVTTILARVPSQLVTLTQHLTDAQLRVPLGVGERSCIEDLAHLLNCEQSSTQKIYLAVLSDAPLVLDLHPERDWGKLLHHEMFAWGELLAYFVFRRKLLKGVLDGLSEAQWARGIREEGKQRRESVYWLARALALHEDEHLTDLHQKIALL
jgi:hypothetical protein